MMQAEFTRGAQAGGTGVASGSPMDASRIVSVAVRTSQPPAGPRDRRGPSRSHVRHLVTRDGQGGVYRARAHDRRPVSRKRFHPGRELGRIGPDARERIERSGLDAEVARAERKPQSLDRCRVVRLGQSGCGLRQRERAALRGVPWRDVLVAARHGEPSQREEREPARAAHTPEA